MRELRSQSLSVQETKVHQIAERNHETMNAHNIFVTSDWHLGHDALAARNHRPENFSQMIMDNHVNSGITRDDVLLHLGDAYQGPVGEFALNNLLAIMRSKGVRTIGLRGNHDPIRFERSMRMGWGWVCDSISLSYHSKRFLFTHVPVETPFEEDYNVHGHLHAIEGHRGGLIRDGKHILISMELMNYHPILLDRLIHLGETPVRSLGKFVGEGAQLVEYPDGPRNVEDPEKTR